MKPTLILIIFFGILLLIAPGSRAQIREYVKTNAISIKSVDFNDTSYDDLLPIARAIGSKRIVMLGELFHGDATTFEVKGRLIRYLHEKLGFNVLAFEGDFFALNDGWEKFQRGGIRIDTLLQSSIFPIWTCCRQAFPAFDYMMNQAGGADTLIITGFDNQIQSGYTMRNLKKYIQKTLAATNIEFIKSAGYSRYLSLVDSPAIARGVNTIPQFDSLINYTSIILNQATPYFVKDDFHIKVFENLLIFYKQVRYYWDTKKQDSSIESPFRDFQMAENLRWLATHKYPHDKIIVWAHNGHIFKNSDSVYNKKNHEGYSMGYYFTREKALLEQTYIMGFTEYSGSGKMINQKSAVKVTRPNKYGLEQWLKETGYPITFIDFSAFTAKTQGNKENFYMKREIFAEGKSYWHQIYDGVLFIEQMKPCESTNGILKN